MRELREGFHDGDVNRDSFEGYSQDFKDTAHRFGVEVLLQGSHFYGSFQNWEAQRRPIAELIKESGKILDFGCANGFLLVCLKEWSGKELDCYGLDVDSHAIKHARELFSEKAEEHFLFMSEEDYVRQNLPKKFETIYWNVWDNVDFSLSQNQRYFEGLKQYAQGGRIILGFYHPDSEENDRRLEQLREMGNDPAEVRRAENGHIFAAFDVSEER